VSSVRLERPNLGQVRRRDAPPFQQVRNVVGAFTIAAPLPLGPLLLVDDVWDSGWVTTVIGEALSIAGVPAVHALTLAAATGG
jgi:predicted amidophosphoribosyltransferase